MHNGQVVQKARERKLPRREQRHRDKPGKGLYIRFGKRALDIAGALVGLFLSSPILLLCALAIWLDSSGLIFYRQWRVGQHGKYFRIFKLRTMIQGVDRRGLKVTASGDRRITKVGNFLRKTKLDEVPQLFNVLRGEMSLVGPRPEVPEYVARYNRRQKQVLEVQPGVTGIDALLFVDESRLLASRPDRESFYVGRVMPCKVEINLTYCRSVSFLGDLEIILLTLGRLLAPSLFSNGTLKDCLRTLGVQEPLLALRSLSGPGPEA